MYQFPHQTTASTPLPAAQAAAIQPVRQRPAFAPHPIPPTTYNNPVVTLPGVTDKTWTVFVGNIPNLVKDAWMQEILGLCGTVKAWRRLKDASGNFKPFGFVEYVVPADVLRVLRILGGQNANSSPILFPTDDNNNNNNDNDDGGGGAIEKPLNVKVDEKTKKAVEAFISVLGDTTAQDVAVINQIQARLNEWFPRKEEDTAANLIMQGLSLMREEKEEKENPRMVPDTSVTKSKIRVGGHEQDERDEVKRRERRRRDMEDKYRERLVSWERRERSKAQLYEQEDEHDQNRSRNRQSRKESLLRKLANLNENTEEFYTDRTLWIRKRQHVRKAELEFDLKDRQKEADELAASKKGQDGEERVRRLADTINDGDDGDVEMRPVNGTGGPAGQATARPHDIREKSPVTPGDSKQPNVVSEAVSSEVKGATAADAEPPSTLPDPRDTKAIMAWPVKWDYCTEQIMQSRIKPYIAEKLVDLLGEPDEDFTDFVLESIRDRMEVQQLAEEVESALGVAPEKFVIPLWEMLVRQTEKACCE